MVLFSYVCPYFITVTTSGWSVATRSIHWEICRVERRHYPSEVRMGIQSQVCESSGRGASSPPAWDGTWSSRTPLCFAQGNIMWEVSGGSASTIANSCKRKFPQPSVSRRQHTSCCWYFLSGTHLSVTAALVAESSATRPSSAGQSIVSLWAWTPRLRVLISGKVTFIADVHQIKTFKDLCLSHKSSHSLSVLVVTDWPEPRICFSSVTYQLLNIIRGQKVSKFLKQYRQRYFPLRSPVTLCVSLLLTCHCVHCSSLLSEVWSRGSKQIRAGWCLVLPVNTQQRRPLIRNNRWTHLILCGGHKQTLPTSSLETWSNKTKSNLHPLLRIIALCSACFQNKKIRAWLDKLH